MSIRRGAFSGFDVRDERRYPTKLTVLVQGMSDAGEMYTSNVSLQGLFISTINPAPENQLLKLQIAIPDTEYWGETKVEMLVFVKHSFDVDTENPNGPGMGVEVYAIDDEHRTMWETYVRAIAGQAALDGGEGPAETSTPPDDVDEEEPEVDEEELEDDPGAVEEIESAWSQLDSKATPEVENDPATNEFLPDEISVEWTPSTLASFEGIESPSAEPEIPASTSQREDESEIEAAVDEALSMEQPESSRKKTSRPRRASQEETIADDWSKSLNETPKTGMPALDDSFDSDWGASESSEPDPDSDWENGESLDSDSDWAKTIQPAPPPVDVSSSDPGFKATPAAEQPALKGFDDYFGDIFDDESGQFGREGQSSVADAMGIGSGPEDRDSIPGALFDDSSNPPRQGVVRPKASQSLAGPRPLTPTATPLGLTAPSPRKRQAQSPTRQEPAASGELNLSEDLEVILRLAVSPEQLLGLDLDPSKAFLLTRIDGFTPVADLVDLVHFEREETLRLLTELVRAGVLTS